ncbi:hypothetical protein HF086_012256 [Spodoptera exigua]|uniref:Uncharacterized protein n=1 Tax=Spodoptera exigua TaxID=7107 RepID=A0A922MGC9_SPOEX|nr:hypothetical protein HF086_012256 [Spodoptera exigua]
MLSIPDSLTDNSDLIKNLKEQINNLKTELSSAHQEIENLSMENFRLKSDLQNMIKTSNTFKKICSTPTRKTISPIQKVKTPNQNIKCNCEGIKDTLSKSQLTNVTNGSNIIMINKETQTITTENSPQINTDRNTTPSIDMTLPKRQKIKGRQLWAPKNKPSN